jgi:hypothetical protein
MEKIYIIHESEFGKEDTCITVLAGDWENAPIDIYQARLSWNAKKVVADGARYQFISESQFPPDWDNYKWDYSNYNGYGSSSYFNQDWVTFASESLEI